MTADLQPDGASVGPGQLSPVGSADALSMGVSDRIRLSDLHAEREAVEQADADVREEIRRELAGDVSDLVLEGEKVNAEILGNLLVDSMSVEGWDKQVRAVGLKNLIAHQLKAAPLIGKAGLTNDYPAWERMLFETLPPAQAMKVAAAIRAEPGISDTDAATIAAGVINAGPEVIFTTNTGRDVPSDGDHEAFHLLGTCEAGDLPVCTAYGPPGYCKTNNRDGATGLRKVVLMGGIPNIHPAPEGVRAPDESFLVAARATWCTDVKWDEKLEQWRMEGCGENRPDCAKDDPPPSPPPGTDPPPSPPPGTSPPPPPPGGPNCPPPVPVEPGCIQYVVNMGTGYMLVPTNYAPGGGTVVPPVPPYVPGGGVVPPVPPTGDDTTDDGTSPPPPPPPLPAPPPIKFDTGCLPLDRPHLICGKLQTCGSGTITATSTPGQPIQSSGTFTGVGSDIASLFSSVFQPVIDSQYEGELTKYLGIEMKQAQGVQKAYMAGRKTDCEADAQCQAELMFALGTARWAERITGAPLTYLAKDLEYYLQYSEPKFILEQPGLDDLYVRGLLSKDQHECYTRALGNLPNLHQTHAETGFVRINVNDNIRLFRLGKITEKEYHDNTKYLGVHSKEDRERLELAADEIPTLPDIMRLMVRDVADEAAVAAGKLDEDFTKKFTGILKDWAKANGITEETAKYFWRAHWEYPSNTELWEMMTRNRPGRVAPDLVVTEADALALLGINDQAPGWRKKKISVAYAVPTRTDLKRGFEIDALKREEVIEGLQDVKYKKADAELLMKIYDEEKVLYKRGIAGKETPWTIKRVAIAYGNGQLSRDEAIRLLQFLQVKGEKHEEILANGLLFQTSKSRAACIKATRHRFLTGELNAGQVVPALRGLGVSVAAADSLFQQWQCEMSSRSKEVGAEKNVKWFTMGIIDLNELSGRLTNLGYTQASITGYLREAVTLAMQAAAKEAEKRAKLAQQARDRYQRELEKAAKKQRQEHADAHHLEKEHGGPPVPAPPWGPQPPYPSDSKGSSP